MIVEGNQSALQHLNNSSPLLGASCPDSKGTEATVQHFAQMWGLDGAVVTFLQALPDPIRKHVLTGFDGSGTKDGNLWGRLLGYTRHTWAKSPGLDQASV